MQKNEGIAKTLTVCPICKVEFSNQAIGAETIDQCQRCQGVWLSGKALANILSTFKAEPFETVDSKHVEAIDCPQCETVIESKIYAHDSGIPIHKCENCEMVWLFGGQLQQISRYKNGPHKTDGLANAIAETYGNAQRLEALGKLVRSRFWSSLFAGVLIALMLFSGGGVQNVFRLMTFLILPMSCIWFADAMGSYTGVRGISRSTPGFAIAIGGWLLLFAAFIVLVSMWLQ